MNNAQWQQCDRCTAEAQVRAVPQQMVWDAAPVQELRFCGHHGRALNQALFDNGWVVDTNIYDLTGRAVV